MNIILSNDIQQLPDSYTILELDIVQDTQGNCQTAWCCVENIPLNEFAILENLKETHANLIKAYRNQEWEYCTSAITALIGRWNGELDSFYHDLGQRVETFSQNPPGDSWNPTLIKR